MNDSGLCLRCVLVVCPFCKITNAAAFHSALIVSVFFYDN